MRLYMVPMTNRMMRLNLNDHINIAFNIEARSKAYDNFISITLTVTLRPIWSK